MSYQDITYGISSSVATISIDRPEVMNAFRALTVDEIINALDESAWDDDVGVIVLTGTGNKAFCTGGDQSDHQGNYVGKGSIGMKIEELHSAIRDNPKPVIAKVNGYAIGGGNVLATICDLTICTEKSIFGQVGPKVGSFDPGFGTAYLASVVGEKKAREMWFMCKKYTAEEALNMGLVNFVVEESEIDAYVDEVAQRISAHSPTAIKFAKKSFNAATEHIRGIGSIGMAALSLYYGTDESKEGAKAFMEKRAPDFRKFR